MGFLLLISWPNYPFRKIGLKTAYETLNRSNSRRMYDLRGEDYFKDDFSLGFDGLGQKWKTCINEVFREFANAK